MSYTATDLTIVENAIKALAGGTRVVSVSTSNGKSISYGQAQLKDLQALRDSIQAEINFGSTSGSRGYVLVSTSKGL